MRRPLPAGRKGDISQFVLIIGALLGVAVFLGVVLPPLLSNQWVSFTVNDTIDDAQGRFPIHCADDSAEGCRTHDVGYQTESENPLGGFSGQCDIDLYRCIKQDPLCDDAYCTCIVECMG
ncbi:hypothetical protein JXB02_03895 [Candidatus Woesearchaeota archaeon]|nr:hypothetical protein [Candidatus Woesearchaeota archaeon]